MKFFINYFKAYTYSGGKSPNSTLRGMFSEIIEILLVLFLFFMTCGVDFEQYHSGFYQLDIAIYCSAFAAFRMSAIVMNGCKYRLTCLVPSNYKMRAVGEIVNAVIMSVIMFAYMCAIFGFSLIVSLCLDAEQIFINLSLNGVEIAFKVSLCIWLAANGTIASRISKFGKRIIYDVIMVVVTVGACMLINNAAVGFERFIAIGDAAARFGMLPNAALWLILSYAISFIAFAVSVFITFKSFKPKQF